MHAQSRQLVRLWGRFDGDKALNGRRGILRKSNNKNVIRARNFNELFPLKFHYSFSQSSIYYFTSANVHLCACVPVRRWPKHISNETISIYVWIFVAFCIWNAWKCERARAAHRFPEASPSPSPSSSSLFTYFIAIIIHCSCKYLFFGIWMAHAPQLSTVFVFATTRALCIASTAHCQHREGIEV